jgi:hypothetical protein
MPGDELIVISRSRDTFRRLASLPSAGSEASLALRARGSILAISEALIEHAAYFDAGVPG